MKHFPTSTYTTSIPWKREMNLKETFEEIKAILEETNMSHEHLVVIMSSIEGMRSECNELRRRLTWLEEKIDEEDMEELCVEYQKRFKIRYWSGDPN